MKLGSGHETTVSLRDVAPCDRSTESIPRPPESESTNENITVGDQNIDNVQNIDTQHLIVHDQHLDSSTNYSTTPPEVHHQPTVATEPQETTMETQSSNDTSNTSQRRSTRNRKPRDLFADSAHSSI